MPAGPGVVMAAPETVVGETTAGLLREQTVLLAGATGKNGSAILRQLKALNVPVRAMSRNAERAASKFGSDGIDWVEADVTEPETLGAAVEGVDVVIWAVATAMPFGGNRPEKVDGEGMASMAQAAKAAGAKRMLVITSASSGDEDHFLNWVGDMMIWKGRGEQALMASGLEYVIVAPAAIDFDAAGGSMPIRLSPRADYLRGQTISSEDLSSAVIAAAARPEAANRIFLVSNGEGAPDPDWQRQLADMPSVDSPASTSTEE
jgi:uncharacterized protein YbjT (DUF2867 family)